MKEMKVRDSNIELLRILMMIVIVAHHYIVNSGIFQMIVNTPPPSDGKRIQDNVCAAVRLGRQNGDKCLSSYNRIFYVQAGIQMAQSFVSCRRGCVLQVDYSRNISCVGI